jgi:aryl-alcohol dehydrogenase-like predicted oxidoreductase
LCISRFGFGGYRLHEFEPDHRLALEAALLGGINIIDTSTNYTNGSSERLIGEVTAALFAKGQIQRDEIVFVTKAGYIQGDTLKKIRNKPGLFQDMVEESHETWHNISPEFLETQINESLARLRIETIDIFLLHNPETYLKASGNREQYYARIEKAFVYLESERKAGRIRNYGVSSNTLTETDAKTTFTSLTRLLEIAKSAGKSASSTDKTSVKSLDKPSDKSTSKRHHFSVIEFPFNLYEPGAALHVNNNGLTTLELAAQEKLGVLTNRPFNSIEKGRLVRLTSFEIHESISLKGRLHQVLGRAIELERESGNPKFAWAQMLRDKIGEIDDFLVWKDVLGTKIIPSLRTALARVPLDMTSWRDSYQRAISEVIELMSADLQNHQNAKTQIIIEQLKIVAPELANSKTLSQMVMRLYLSFPQIHSVLVGMRHPSYVTELLDKMDYKLLDKESASKLVTGFQRHRLQ